MSFLQDLYNGKLNGQSWSMPKLTSTRTLPNSGGTYQTPIVTPQPQSPGLFIGPQQQKITPPAVTTQPRVTTPPAVTTQSKYINPTTGNYYTPEEYANSIATKIPVTKGTGDIGQYAGDALTNPNQTKEQLNRSAYGMSGARNDISTGTTDPYDITGGGKIVYSPQERAAIEKAYAGIYDPALSDVFTKLDTLSKKEASDLEQKNKLEQMALQHKYSMAEKGLTSTGTSLSGSYVKGANPAVDAWAQRIFDGQAKITDIPASEKGMRNAVTIALTDSGNDLFGRPTVTELGRAAKSEAENIMKDFKSGKGRYAVGGSRFWGGALATQIPGSESFDFANSVNNLVNNLSLEGVRYLKGQGSVSDAERALLANAVTKLKLSQSEGEFEETLQSIIDKLSGSDYNVLHSPDGTQEVTKSDLTPEQLKEAADAGWY